MSGQSTHTDRDVSTRNRNTINVLGSMSVNVYFHTHLGRYPRVTAYSNDREALQAYADAFGGNLYEAQHGAHDWFWYTTQARQGERAMRMLRPIASERNRQLIDKCLATWEGRPNPRRPYRLKEQSESDALRLRMAEIGVELIELSQTATGTVSPRSQSELAREAA